MEPEMRIERDWGIGEGRWEAGGGAEGECVMDRQKKGGRQEEELGPGDVGIVEWRKDKDIGSVKKEVCTRLVLRTGQKKGRMGEIVLLLFGRAKVAGTS